MLYLESGRVLSTGVKCVYVHVVLGVWRKGLVESEAEGWGGPWKRVGCGRPYMPLILSFRPALTKRHSMGE